MSFFNSAETMSRSSIEDLQLARLKETLEHVYKNGSYYRRKFDDAGVEPGDVKSLDDLSKLPFMSKEDFRAGYPLEMLCVPREELREMHMSSGSTGTPVVMAYTQADLDQWGECVARCYRMAGMEKGESVQITPSFGLFNGGFGAYHGARKADLFIIPAGAGNTDRQIKLINDFKVKCLLGVVSYGIRIVEVLKEKKLALPSLTTGIFGAESFSDSMREVIEGELGIEAYDIYGMTETGGIGTTGMDCKFHNGIHVWDDHYITEIIDPQTGKVLPDGETGEVVFTSLTRQAIPVIRFKTGDLTRIVSREKCECGRTTVRIDRIKGRCDDMLIVKGVNFFPKQVEQALLEIPGVLPHYQIIIEENNGVRDVRINVEAEPGVTGYMVEKHLKEKLGFSPAGDVFAPGALPRQEGKAVRVFYKNCSK